MKAKIKEVSISEDGRCWLTLTVPLSEKERLRSLMREDVDIEVEKYREKRSKNANSYMWVLCDRIADAVGITKSEVYRDAVKNVGIWKEFQLPEAQAKTLQHSWEMLGEGWVTECDYAQDGNEKVVKCYYGSSTYNTKQMARLIDYIVNEAQNLDIETLTPTELYNLKSLWEANNA